jgi:hypothetical protein
LGYFWSRLWVPPQVIAGVLANAGLMGKKAQEVTQTIFPAGGTAPVGIGVMPLGAQDSARMAKAVSREESNTANESLLFEPQQAPVTDSSS